MTFEELKKGILEIHAKQIIFDYSHARLTMTIQPSYFTDVSMKNQLFSASLDDCIYFSTDNTSILLKEGYTEFVEWGVKPNYCCRSGDCKLMKELLARNTNRDLLV
jgi:hypothetical protein